MTMNRSRFFFLLIALVSVNVVVGQDYIVQGITPKLYLNHQVAAKETWYSIGRAYNVAARELASFNKLPIDKPLEIGQSIQVPLTASNFTQADSRQAGEELQPVYHVVGHREWMYRISVNYNKVPIERLEKWNNINRDDAKEGTRLIVGYLKVNGGNDVARQQPATPTHTTTQTPSASAQTEQKTPAAVGEAGGGYFKSQYRDGGKNHSGVAGVFRSTSGWNDGKYYALINNVTVGTIVRIVFPQTDKSVYAKVLGELPDMKESAGLALRISDAAAKELGAVKNKFSVQVMY